MFFAVSEANVSLHIRSTASSSAAPPLPERVGDLASSEPTPTSTPPGTPSALDIRLAPMLASFDSSPLEGMCLNGRANVASLLVFSDVLLMCFSCKRLISLSIFIVEYHPDEAPTESGADEKAQEQQQQQRPTTSKRTTQAEEPPPPPAPPVPEPTVTLPPNWKMAKDAEGKYYYYHSVTRKTQWDPPSPGGGSGEGTGEGASEEKGEEEEDRKSMTAGPSRTSLSDLGESF